MNTIRLLLRPLPTSVAAHWQILRSFLLTPVVLFIISVPIVLVASNERSSPGESLFVLFILLHVGWYAGGTFTHLLLSWLKRRHWWHYAITGFLLAAALPLFLAVASIALRVVNPEAPTLQLVVATVAACTFYGAIGVASVSVFWWLARSALENAP